MKKEKKIEDDLIFIMVVMFMLSIFGSSSKGSKNISMRVEETRQIESESEEEKERLVTVTVTRYNPVIDQCDEDPLITADNSKIDLRKLKNEELRWVAVSRDLLGEFSYGDTIKLTCQNDSSINGFYTIHDCMNKRWKNRVDILTHVKSDHGRGKWEDVKLEKIIREGN
jgi:3D (Asp-Asp-Asp) domain-containing protein